MNLVVQDLGRLPYREAYELQVAARDALMGDRDRPASLLLVEHDPPVITVSRRPSAASHLVASAEHLREAGVQVEPTNRGGDITYHGPGQLVVYPILDLRALDLRLHDYMRLLEDAAIRTLARFNVVGRRDQCATGVWVDDARDPEGGAKICAIGIRVSRHITMHGLALNVSTDLAHFDFIVPCGLEGRPVTSLAAMLRQQGIVAVPSMAVVKGAFVASLRQAIEDTTGITVRIQSSASSSSSSTTS